MKLIVTTIALDLSLLDALDVSIDYPIEKVLINGGRADALDDWRRKHPDWRIFHYGKNLGFAGSVNMAPSIFPNEDAFLLMNDDGEFQAGCLKRMCDAAAEHAKDCHMIYVNEYQAFDICVWTRKCINDFGLFDENFFPSYYDDWEMRARFKLKPFKAHIIPAPFPVKHGRKRPAGPKYHAMLSAIKPLNESYFMRKWGAIGDDPIFKNPFFNPANKISDWSIEQDNREKRELICSRFWNQPNPSIYE